MSTVEWADRASAQHRLAGRPRMTASDNPGVVVADERPPERSVPLRADLISDDRSSAFDGHELAGTRPIAGAQRDRRVVSPNP